MFQDAFWLLLVSLPVFLVVILLSCLRKSRSKGARVLGKIGFLGVVLVLSCWVLFATVSLFKYVYTLEDTNQIKRVYTEQCLLNPDVDWWLDSERRVSSHGDLRINWRKTEAFLGPATWSGGPEYRFSKRENSWNFEGQTAWYYD